MYESRKDSANAAQEPPLMNLSHIVLHTIDTDAGLEVERSAS